MLPRSTLINGKKYLVGSLKGRVTSRQKAYLAAALNATEKASITAHSNNQFTYDTKVIIDPDISEEKLSVELCVDTAGWISSVTLGNASWQKSPFHANFDGATVLCLNEESPSIPINAVFDGNPLPWHPDGERYQAIPYKQSGSLTSVALTGIPHANGHTFNVYDVKTHQYILQLQMVWSRKGTEKAAAEKVLISPKDMRLLGGTRLLKFRAPGVKTSKSSPTGFKQNGKPCDRHGNAIISSSSFVQDASSLATQPLRSALTKTVENHMKQYWLDGQPIGPIYPVKQPHIVSADLGNISEKYSSTIYPRRNPASPYVKKIKTGITLTESQHKIEVRNKIARLVAGSLWEKHFVVEIFSGEKNGNPEYIARRVNGFSLDNLEALNALKRKGKLDNNTLKTMMNSLGEAVDWLNNSSYFHNDIQLGNIMYDDDNHTLVLIDFELADTTELYGRFSERAQIDAINNNLF